MSLNETIELGQHERPFTCWRQESLNNIAESYLNVEIKHGELANYCGIYRILIIVLLLLLLIIIIMIIMI